MTIINPVSVARQYTATQHRVARSNTQSQSPANITASVQPVGGDQLLQKTADASRQQFLSLISRNDTTNADVDNADVDNADVDNNGVGDSSQAAGITLAKLTQALQTRFAAAAANRTQFHTLLKQSLGDNYDVSSAETLRQQSCKGNFSWLPCIKVVDGQTLDDTSGTKADGVGLGAYSVQMNTIYLAAQLLDGDVDKALNVLIEETGHALDATLNDADAAGDEGALFAKLFLGESITTHQLNELKAENDTGSITVDGKQIEVEYSWVSKQFRRTGRQIDDSLIQPAVAEAQRFGKHLRDTIEHKILQPVKDAGKIVLRGAQALLGTVLVRSFQEAWGAITGYSQALKHFLLKGEYSQAWDVFKDTSINLATAPFRQTLEAGAIALHTTVGVVDTVVGGLEVRKLSAQETEYLQGIFGDSIDYSEISIHTGGVKDYLFGMRANVVGNDVFMPDQVSIDGTWRDVFNTDGTMTTAGMELLGHEVAHVWQFQKHGTRYIGESLLGQMNHLVFDKLLPIGAADPYEWHGEVFTGVEFEDLGPEQQAEVAQLIGVALTLNAAQTNPPRDPAVPFSADNLAAAMEPDSEAALPAGVYEIFLRAHDILRR